MQALLLPSPHFAALGLGSGLGLGLGLEIGLGLLRNRRHMIYLSIYAAIISSRSWR